MITVQPITLRNILRPTRAITRETILLQEKCRVCPEVKLEITKIKYSKDKLIKIIKSYFIDGKLKRRIISDEQNSRAIKHRISKFEKFNGISTIINSFIENEKEVSRKQNSVFRRNTGVKPVISIKFDINFLENNKRQETQLIETLVKGRGRTKYLKTTAERLENGKLTHTSIDGNVKRLDILSNDPYLFIRNYTNRDFAQSAIWIAKRNQNIDTIDGRLLDEPLTHGVGAFMKDTGDIIIDTSVHPNKTTIVETLNHESKHKFQYSQVKRFFEYIKTIFKPSNQKCQITKKEMLYALKIYFSDLLYCPPFISKKYYLNNFIEKEAITSSLKATQDYVTRSEFLADTFKAPHRMFHVHDDMSYISKEEFLETLKENIRDFIVINM